MTVTHPVRAEAARQRDRLAELMAEGCPTVTEAATRMGLTQQRASKHWRRICDDLGRQAR